MRVLFIHYLFVLDATLDFLRPGDFSSKLQTYHINEEENVTLIMDNYADNYSEEVAYRVCRNDVSPIKQSVSCCDCYNSKECEWGILASSSSPQHICLFMASQPGLYQFEIYTSYFPCYQKIGGPFKINKHFKEKHKATKQGTVLYVIFGCLCMAILILLLYAFGVTYIKRKGKIKPI